MERGFREAVSILERRISLSLDLPLKTLDRLALLRELGYIGRSRTTLVTTNSQPVSSRSCLAVLPDPRDHQSRQLVVSVFSTAFEPGGSRRPRSRALHWRTVKTGAGVLWPTASGHFARYTVFPATIVHNTFVSRICSGEIVRTSRSSKTRSARLPAAIVPMESRFMARAEFRV